MALHFDLIFESRTTVSCGATAAPVSSISGPELIAADVALYAAKRNGRNQVWPQ